MQDAPLVLTLLQSSTWSSINSIAVTTLALELGGNPGVNRDHPLERHHRDALCGGRMRLRTTCCGPRSPRQPSAARPRRRHQRR